MAPLAVVLGRAAPLGVEIDAVAVRVPSHVVPVHMGRHRQWRRHLHARSLVLDAEYLLHRMLALRLDKLPRLVRHRRSNARKREGAVRRARPGSPRVFEPLVELVEPHIVAGVCGPAVYIYLLRVFLPLLIGRFQTALSWRLWWSEVHKKYMGRQL